MFGAGVATLMDVGDLLAQRLHVELTIFLRLVHGFFALCPERDTRKPLRNIYEADAIA
jgi:hypothetical protein